MQNNKTQGCGMVFSFWGWMPWVLLFQAGLLGGASAAACGCGSDGVLLFTTWVLLVLGAQASRWSVLGVAHDLRVSGRFMWVLVVLGLVWLALQSRGHVLVLGGMAMVLARGLAFMVASPVGRQWTPLGVILVALVLVALSDGVQRQAWLWIPSATALSWAMLVGVWAAFRCWDTQPSAGWVRVVSSLAHACLAASVWALVSPQAAAWGLVTLPMVLWRPTQHTAMLTALLHGAVLTLALWQMGMH